MCLGIPGRILSLDPATPDQPLVTGRVSFAGVVRSVCLSYVPEATVGDHVLVHAGFAISVLDARAAERALAALDAAGVTVPEAP
jgi:hydrogenase expression/formation protein HypC